MTPVVCGKSKAMLASLGVALAICAIGAAQASAASIVYTKDGNVWIANPDGSGQYQVTLDGTTASPYRHASQSDDGTIVANRGQSLYVLRQNGGLISKMDQASILGPPGAPAISPDGSMIAYEGNRNACGAINTRCYTTVLVGIDGTERGVMRGGTTNPSWIGNVRLLSTIGQDTWVSTLVGGAPSDIQPWFNTSGLPAPTLALTPSFIDPEVSTAGDKIALLANPERLVLYAGNGPYPAAPTHRCTFENLAGGVIFAGPSWSPDGTQLAWSQGDGIWSATFGATLVDGCPGVTPTRIIPGGKDPDWGPANVNPGTRPTTPAPSDPTPGRPTPTAGKLTVGLVAPKAAKFGSLRAKGLRVKMSVSGDCTGAVALAVQKGEAKRLKVGNDDTVIGQVGPGKLDAGSFAATIKLKKKYAVALRSARGMTAFVVATCSNGSAKPVVAARKIRFTP